MSTIERTPTGVGKEFGTGLRNTSKYNESQRDMDALGGMENLHDLGKLGEVTPPVGVNLGLILKMQTLPVLSEHIQGIPQKTAIIGLTEVDGVTDFQKFLRFGLHTTFDSLTVIDIDNTILKEVDALEFQNVVTIWKDAQHTELPSTSLDIVLRDHLGNCCPPVIDRAIDKETSRITKQKGISFVNITTSDALWKSPNREVIPFDTLLTSIGQSGIDSLRMRIFDLSQLKNEFGSSVESLRGKLLEIEPQSFVIFGEDSDGHGEWFRPWNDHVKQWEQNGFQILEVKEREGNDSHEPPLRCHRHNVILLKKGATV